MKDTQRDTNAVTPPRVAVDVETLAAEARASVEKSAAELRKHRVPIATEPPTVYRP